MERDKQARKRFADKKWDGMEPMVEAYAAEAILIAKADFHEELAYDEASLPKLERILNRLCPAPSPLPAEEGRWLTLLWGSFFGELLRHRHGGMWAMTVYPGSELSVPTLEMSGAPADAITTAATGSTALPGSRLYPMMKVHRRLSLGAQEGIPAFYTMLSARLAASRKHSDQ